MSPKNRGVRNIGIERRRALDHEEAGEKEKESLRPGPSSISVRSVTGWENAWALSFREGERFVMSSARTLSKERGERTRAAQVEAMGK
jgi:hypothetical protein